MQVLFEESEFKRMQAAARACGQTLAEWVRGHLRSAVRSTAGGDQQHKLDAVRSAHQHEFPTADIDQMLEEIETGYRLPR
ncbi:MAG: hypothetical protein LC667_09785 [Thioalkalivibrio sp.]|nr:hypothetical protein [Thioalkalivibrio sp.]